MRFYAPNADHSKGSIIINATYFKYRVPKILGLLGARALPPLSWNFGADLGMFFAISSIAHLYRPPADSL